MPCGERCKIILDGGIALQRAMECMRNTVLLKHGGEHGPSADLAARYRAKADELAVLCAEIEASFNG